MEKKNATQQITAQLVKSNASEYLVWEVSVSNSRCKKHYCKTATKTLSYIFFLKKQKNIAIDYRTLRHLKAVIAKQKASATIANMSTEVQQ